MSTDAKVRVAMTVNGRQVSAEVEPRTLLIHFLRENLNLTGPHIGCDTSHCGACTVDLDGKSVKSCTVFAVQAEGAERPHHRGHGRRRRQPASAAGGVPRASRAAMRLLHAGHDHPRATGCCRRTRTRREDEIRMGISGNLCRCTGYQNIVKAISAAAETIAGLKKKEAAE